MALERQAEQRSVDLSHYATKAELSQLEVRLVRDIGDVREDVANLRGEVIGLRGEIKGLRGEFRLLLAGIGILATVVAVVLRFWPF